MVRGCMKKTLLALALIVSSSALSAEELPLKIGDLTVLSLDDGKTVLTMVVTDIKGKWIECEPTTTLGRELAGRVWVNSEKVLYFSKTQKR